MPRASKLRGLLNRMRMGTHGEFTVTTHVRQSRTDAPLPH